MVQAQVYSSMNINITQVTDSDKTTSIQHIITLVKSYTVHAILVNIRLDY
jgi:hypothetical protein